MGQNSIFENSPYMGGEVKLKTGDKGQIANAILLDSRKRIEPQARKLTDNLYCIMGLNICNSQLIIGKSGLIVVDTGNSYDEGVELLKMIREVSSKKIKAVIYTHSHYTHGTQALIDGNDEEIDVIGHYKLHRNFCESLRMLPQFFRRRQLMESAAFLPKEGPDADSAGGRVRKHGISGYVEPNRVIRTDGEEIELAGIQFRFHIEYPFDTDDTMFMWLPECKAIIHNHFSSNFPNIYPVEGGHYRDPVPWIEGIDLMRRYSPEYVLGTHGGPSFGNKEVMERLTVMRDALQYVHDQTVRGMNRHLTQDELVEFVQLPKHLEEHPWLKQTYGEVSNHIRGIFSGLAGWFSGDAADIHKTPIRYEAEEIVKGFGGKDKVKQKLNVALEKQHYAWAVQLGRYLFRFDSQDIEICNLYSEALRRMAQVSPAWTVRNYYLSQALEVENKVDTKKFSIFLDRHSALKTEPGQFIHVLSLRINPQKTIDVNKTLSIIFTDLNKHFGLIIRKGIAEFYTGEPQNPDLEIRLSRSQWIDMVIGKMSIEQILDSSVVKVYPNKNKVIVFFSFFDSN